MRKKFTLTCISLLVLVLLTWFGGRWLLSFSVANYSGNMILDGPNHPIEITFDAKGIPQVWAETDRDLYFALGWLHASERLFRMELLRRVAFGRVSEIIGPSTYDLDLRMRQIGFARRGVSGSRELDEESRKFMTAYADGINAWVDSKSVLPPEFYFLDIDLVSWTVDDCLTIAYYQTWYSHQLRDFDERYRLMIDKLDGNIAEILRDYKSWSPSTVPSPDHLSSAMKLEFPLRMTDASNTWVISPEKSASGSAMHASDPHLEIRRVPGFWYIAGLHSNEGMNVVGVSTPGVPMITMGHNDSIAYAFTVASVDIIDYYRELRDPSDSLSVLGLNGYRPMTVRHENILVKGEESPRNQTIYETEIGPVVESDSTSVTTLKWAGFDSNIAKIVRSAIDLHRTHDFKKFRRVVTGMGALDVNWTYSDRAGNIGYQLGPPIPNRSYENTYAVLNAEDSTHYWDGYRELEETPYVYNPAQGWAATCNNQPVTTDFGYRIPGFYDPYRIIRANALLAHETVFDREKVKEIQLDQVSARALRWKHLMAEGAEANGHTGLAQELNDWNGRLSTESRLASLFAFWWYEMGRCLFEDDLGEEWWQGTFIQEEVLTNLTAPVIDDKRTTTVTESVTDIAAAALDSAIVLAEERPYGEVSRLYISHPLSSFKVLGLPILDSWLDLNRGPLPIGGDLASLNANFQRYDSERNEFYCVGAPSMRYILDWADVDGFTINTNLGQSGNPFSPHYDDFLELWEAGDTWNVPFSKSVVYDRAASILRLIPAE